MREVTVEDIMTYIDATHGGQLELAQMLADVLNGRNDAYETKVEIVEWIDN